MFQKPNIKNILVVLFFIFGVIILLGGCSSAESSQQPTVIGEPADTEEPAPEPTVKPLPEQSVLYEKRIIYLEWPEKIKVGESDRIQLILEVDEEGKITPTVSVEGNKQESEPILIPDLYENYYLNVESRLDIAGMDVLPEGVVSTALIKGKKVIFAWSLSPRQSGIFSGTVWLHLNLIPKNGDFAQKELLFAKPIKIEGTTIFGLSSGTARWAGVVGTGTSFILGLPFIENLLAWLYLRFKKPSIIKTNIL